MTNDIIKNTLSSAKKIQDEINNSIRPPVEITPSFNEVVLPFSLFKNTRGYVEKIVIQINRTYENTCYDACAVMIRRLIEVLIIETCENHKIADKIKNQNGDFLYLQDLIQILLAENPGNLSRNTKSALPKLKDIGDKSAHSRRYNAQRTDIDSTITDLRVVTEELLYLAGLKK